MRRRLGGAPAATLVLPRTVWYTPVSAGNFLAIADGPNQQPMVQASHPALCFNHSLSNFDSIPAPAVGSRALPTKQEKVVV